MRADPGIYALILPIRSPIVVMVGALGLCRFNPGWCVYVGSAHGAGGLRAPDRSASTEAQEAALAHRLPSRTHCD